MSINKNNKNNLVVQRYILQMLPECFFCLSLYLFFDWHIVLMLKIQIKP